MGEIWDMFGYGRVSVFSPVFRTHGGCFYFILFVDYKQITTRKDQTHEKNT